MSDREDMEIDPNIAAAMGFSGFGMQGGTKRKFDANDGFIDPSLSDAQKPAKVKGANDMPLGDRTIQSPKANNTAMPKDERPVGQSGDRPQPSSIGENKEPSLQDLANGVRNADGDMVYFLPSFIEDPWKDLKPK
ncbi:hypothetical protein LTR37_021157 [Vermiconidia calcicola]|uniref:Uncharacterized protein n=1 Tax=Vermiconidia calcicola TaxID=1690605 RepID=A0ACC3MB56_9PEZI|nr:hypothetical protein LTR37_021157 [Vermiconidia calcicola]